MVAGVIHPKGVQRESKPRVIKISELYGPVVQGEGWRIGGPTIFVRTGGCDFHCSWCDSLYAVEPQYRDEWVPHSAEEVIEKVKALLPEGYKTGHITLSGGNPTIQDPRAMASLVRLAHLERIKVGVETQGTRFPAWTLDVDDMTISPKPPSSGNVTPIGEGTALTKYFSAISKIQGGPEASLKVVVFDEKDWEYAQDVHREYPDIRMYVQVGTDVGNDTRDDLIDKLAALQERTMADPDMQDVYALVQLHVIMHGHARGI